MSANRLKLNSEKKELVWVGSRYGHTPLGSGGPSLQLGTDSVAASDHVRVLGVTISSDLGLDKHVSNVCVKCFFLASPIETSPTFTRRRVREDTRARFCHDSPRLL